jgi:hypothetical protein
MNRRAVSLLITILCSVAVAAAPPAVPTKIPPTFRVKGKSQPTKTIGTKEYAYVNYTFEVTNADQYPASWFQKMTSLPAESCWNGPASQERMVLELVWGEFERANRKGVCIPLSSRDDLAAIEFSMPEAKGIAASIQIMLRDRLTGVRHESGLLMVDDTEIPSLLKTVGCTRFLGRPGDYLCKSDAGFAACTNLQKKARLNQCRH